MLCQECKEKQATVHLTKIINEHKTQLHLCEDCARQRESFISLAPFSINDLIASIMDIGNSQLPYDKPIQTKCGVCGMDYNQFKKLGRLGCQECYKSFSKELAPVLRKIQGRAEHTGKVPKRSSFGISKKKQLTDLKGQLKKAIEDEAYERAAKLRDLIKIMEQPENEQGGARQ